MGNNQQVDLKKAKHKALDYLGMNGNSFEEVSSKSSGKILGIDYGTKNIGLAISDQEQKQAFVYETLRVSSKLFNQIKEICQKELIDKIVVGLPLGLNGEYTDKTNEAVCFVEELETRVKVIVETQDERLSSVEADRTQSGHGRDESSARIILEQYLDKKNNNV